MSRLSSILGLVALAAVLAACSGASAAPATPGPSTGSTGESTSITAKDMQFVAKAVIVSGQGVTYDVPSLAAGTYNFLCQVHPDMKGTITAK